MQTAVTIEGGKASVKIDATHNSKAKTALLLFEFHTKEEDLLNALLRKYKMEKVSAHAFNPNNHIYHAMLGDCSIAINVPENKIAQNIVLMYSYLAKSELRGRYKKSIKEGNYKNMMSDISSFKVVINGKCNRFIQQIKTDKAKDKISNGFKLVSPKDREKISNDKVEDQCSCVGIVDTVDDTAQMYLAAAMSDIPCYFKKSGKNTEIHFYTCADCCAFEEFLMMKEKVILQTNVRSFLTQSGNVGVPSANDKGGEKFKEKCKNILASENSLAYILSKLKGFSFKFDDVKELKKVDQKAMSAIMRVKKQ